MFILNEWTWILHTGVDCVSVQMYKYHITIIYTYFYTYGSQVNNGHIYMKAEYSNRTSIYMNFVVTCWGEYLTSQPKVVMGYVSP